MNESGIDLPLLLSSREGLQLLENDANKFGINITSISNTKNAKCLDYLITSPSNWDYERTTPIGYESLETSKSLIMDEILSINTTLLNYNKSNIIHSITMTDYKVLPKDDTVNSPKFILLPIDSDDPFISGQKLLRGTSIQFRLRCIIPRNFTGHLGRYLVFSFSEAHKISPTCMSKYEFISGIRVAG